MPVSTMTIVAVPGETEVTDPDLYNREIFMVRRSGRGFNIINTDPDAIVPTPGSREVVVFGGRLIFLDPFAGPTFGRPNRRDLEDIFIIYRT